MNRIRKTCVDCGIDVAGKPRWKDAHGRYLCEHCWQSGQSSESAPPSTSPAVDGMPVELGDERLQLPDIVAPTPTELATADAGTICPECHSVAAVSPDGRRGKCTRCNKTFNVADANAKLNATRLCPNCGEAIKTIAKQCRFCGLLTPFPRACYALFE